MDTLRPLLRILASFGSWLVAAGCLTLLILGALEVMISNGGFCASGGPYEIADGHQCSDAVVAVLPLSILIGLAAVGAGVWLTKGFGMPLSSWAWTALFCGLGAGFLIAYAQEPAAIVALIIGLVFEAMGLVPFILLLRADPKSLLLGTANAAGARFVGAGGRRNVITALRRRPQIVVGADGTLGMIAEPEAEEEIVPRVGDWALSIGVGVLGAFFGVACGLAIWAALS